MKTHLLSLMILALFYLYLVSLNMKGNLKLDTTFLPCKPSQFEALL